jgi:coenzyme F420 hydrogenase subunit beta
LTTDKTNIGFVVKDGLCTGCGTCAGLCLANAVEMVIDQKKGVYIPVIDNAKCTGCGLCVKVCPGNEVDFKQLNQEIFGKQPEDPLLGNYLNCYTGHANDHDIRYNCSSGGVVTALLIYALENKIIDGALVTRMKKDKPLEPEPFIARTREEIYEARGSKYCPVPANIALREILNAKGKYAIIGIPCQIQGVLKAERILKSLKENITLKLGLFCGHMPTFYWTKLILKSIGMEKEIITKFQYRGFGWPGEIFVETANKTQKFLSLSYASSHYGPFCYHHRCNLCYDHVSELADLSCGDAWLPGFSQDKLGTSLVICRTKRGKDYLISAESQRIIKINISGSNKVIESQRNGIYFKKHVRSRFFFSKLLFKPLPLYNVDLLTPRSSDYFRTIMVYFDAFISSKRLLWFILPVYGSLKYAIGSMLKRFETKHDKVSIDKPNHC